jgi:hypothetical protein
MPSRARSRRSLGLPGVGHDAAVPSRSNEEGAVVLIDPNRWPSYTDTNPLYRDDVHHPFLRLCAWYLFCVVAFSGLLLAIDALF